MHHYKIESIIQICFRQLLSVFGQELNKNIFFYKPRKHLLNKQFNWCLTESGWTASHMKKLNFFVCVALVSRELYTFSLSQGKSALGLHIESLEANCSFECPCARFTFVALKSLSLAMVMYKWLNTILTKVLHIYTFTYIYFPIAVDSVHAS